MSCGIKKSAIDIGSPVISDIRISFRSALKIFPLKIIKKKKIFSPVTANFSASNRLILVFLSYLEVSGNLQKSTRNYMAADGHTETFQDLASFYNIWLFFNEFFKI